jgi:hypothetical protein
LRPRSRIGRADTSAAIPGCWEQALALHLFAGELAGAAESLAFFANSSFGRFLISPSALHLPKYALALHLFLQNAQRLFDVVIADDYLQIPGSFISVAVFLAAVAARLDARRNGIAESYWAKRKVV